MNVEAQVLSKFKNNMRHGYYNSTQGKQKKAEFIKDIIEEYGMQPTSLPTRLVEAAWRLEMKNTYDRGGCELPPALGEFDVCVVNVESTFRVLVAAMLPELVTQMTSPAIL
jgi:hypothetical protein